MPLFYCSIIANFAKSNNKYYVGAGVEKISTYGC